MGLLFTLSFGRPVIQFPCSLVVVLVIVVWLFIFVCWCCFFVLFYFVFLAAARFLAILLDIFMFFVLFSFVFIFRLGVGKFSSKTGHRQNCGFPRPFCRKHICVLGDFGFKSPFNGRAVDRRTLY